jgi:hypothetical protein
MPYAKDSATQRVTARVNDLECMVIYDLQM